MSQHILYGQSERYFIRLGWDSIYHTFFLQVADTWDGDEEEAPQDLEPFLWLGQITDAPITTLEQILNAVEPYGVVPQELQEQLRREQAGDVARGRVTEAPSQLDIFFEYQLTTEAQELFVAQRYDEALGILDKVLARNPEAVVAVAMKAGIEAELGQRGGEQREGHTRRAIELYQQAIALAYAQGYKQITPRLRVGLGRAYAEAGQSEDALRQYDQALDDIAGGTVLDPTDEILALEAKADLFLYYKHDPIGAIPYYEQVVRLDPENEVVQYNLGLTRLAKQQRDEAQGE